MLKPHAVCSSLLLIIASLGTALGQNEIATSDKSHEVTITAAATAERVRFAALPSVVQIRLEVYDSTGKKLGSGTGLNADYDFFAVLHRAGRRAARRFLDEHFGDIGHRSTLDLTEDFAASA